MITSLICFNCKNQVLNQMETLFKDIMAKITSNQLNSAETGNINYLKYLLVKNIGPISNKN
jgi:hypothetical protein